MTGSCFWSAVIKGSGAWREARGRTSGLITKGFVPFAKEADASMEGTREPWKGSLSHGCFVEYGLMGVAGPDK